MNIVIIEDEAIAAQNIAQILAAYPTPVQILAVLRSVKKAVEWLKTHAHQVDLLLMDIQLTDGISFEVFDHISVQKPIIFTTAFDEYAIRAFKLNSVDYLLKPIVEKDLFAALDKWKSVSLPNPIIDYQLLAQQIQLNTPAYKQRFLVKSGSSLLSISIDQIAYFLAEGNFVRLRTLQNKNYPVSYSLEQLAELLDPKFFFRVTRNVVIHIHAIGKVQTFFKGRLKVDVHPALQDGLVVSSKKAGSFKEWLDR